MKAKQRGAVLLFMLVLIAVLSFFVDSLLPKPEATYGKNRQRANDALNEICFALRDYQYDKKDMPATFNFMEDTNFVGKYLNTGLMADATTWKGSMVTDPWGGANNYYADSMGNPMPNPVTFRQMWSVGINGTDNDGGGDDIKRTQYTMLPARARTRRLLDLIRACSSSQGVTLTGVWAGVGNRRGECNLGPEFDRDGWSSNFYILSNVVYSCGVNMANNAGAGDDILW